MNTKKIISVATIITVVATLFSAIYIMYNRMGLQSSLDFGAGAYYYADIPEFDRFTNKPNFITDLPYWFYLLLFILWGLIMYWFWIWVDSKNKKN